MSGSKLPAFAAALLCLMANAIAAPPRDKNSVISAKNVDQVRLVREVDKRVHRIIRGPHPGELTLLDWNNSAEVVDDETIKTRRVITRKQRPVDLAVSPDGKHIAWTERDQGTYTIEDLASGNTVVIDGGEIPGSAAFSPDNKWIAIGRTVKDPIVDDEGYSEVRIHDLSGKLVRVLDKSAIGSLRPVFSPDGKTLAVGNRNDETRLFDVATGALLHTLGKQMTQEIAFSPDGKLLAVGYVDGTIAMWDPSTGELRFSKPSGCREVYSVDWNPNGDLMVTSGDAGKIVLWDPSNGTKLKELAAPTWVIQVRFTADGTRLLSSSSSDVYAKKDRKITVWAIPDAL